MDLRKQYDKDAYYNSIMEMQMSAPGINDMCNYMIVCPYCNEIILRKYICDCHDDSGSKFKSRVIV